MQYISELLLKKAQTWKELFFVALLNFFNSKVEGVQQEHCGFFLPKTRAL
jgi:hypothetical protein